MISTGNGTWYEQSKGKFFSQVIYTWLVWPEHGNVYTQRWIDKTNGTPRQTSVRYLQPLNWIIP